MISFSIAIVVLILGYIFYGRFVGRLFGVDENRPTPAMQHQDGVDYVKMPNWKIFMIQFLNIAGIGPIYGAIMGAQFGTASFLWIVFGTIFAGGVHDFVSAMISVRHNGENPSVIAKTYLGKTVSVVFIVFTMILLILLGAVFVSQPAEIIARLTPARWDVYFWTAVIFGYYIIATLFPIDKIIGRVYPLFAVALIFMAVGLLVMLYVRHPALPEIWTGLGTKYEKSPIFPMMFVSIACGAISGFHSTQSPLMARCITNEKQGRPIFYGAMVTEGIVALIWAAAATTYYQAHGIGDPAGVITMNISKEWLGSVGGMLAIMGVIAAPISSGDTALRSARLVIADAFHLEQQKIRNRFIICIPLFIVVTAVLVYSVRSQEGFNIVWRYFSWSNQVLATITLWVCCCYLAVHRRCYWITLVPAIFMTFVVMTFILMAPTGSYIADRGLSDLVAYAIAGAITVFVTALFVRYTKLKRQ